MKYIAQQVANYKCFNSKDEVKSDDSDEDAENESVQSSSAPGKSPKTPKRDLTMADEVSI